MVTVFSPVCCSPVTARCEVAGLADSAVCRPATPPTQPTTESRAEMRLDLDTVELQGGAHPNPKAGLCVMEAVAYIAREQHSDHPQCVSPVIAAFLRSWNDVMSTADRQKLKALIPVVMDTVGTAADEDRRAWMCLDWLVREYTPAWLRLAGLTDQATTLAGLPRFKAGMDVPSVRPAIESVRRDAAAAWDAARAAAGDAAWDAAGDAAGAAAWAAAGAAARAAAGDAAALRPTVDELQVSAMALVERMAWLKDGDE